MFQYFASQNTGELQTSIPVPGAERRGATWTAGTASAPTFGGLGSTPVSSGALTPAPPLAGTARLVTKGWPWETLLPSGAHEKALQL